MAGPIAKLVDKLDLFDGKRDGTYITLPIRNQGATGSCLLVEQQIAKLRKQGYKGRIRAQVSFKNASGGFTKVDCNQFAQKMNVLVGIASKLPSFTFFAQARRFGAGRVKMLRLPTRDELYSFHLVDHMITALISGVSKSSDSYKQLFSAIPFVLYSKMLHQWARILKVPNYQRVNITTAMGAYKVFEAMGRKYRFNATPFKPVKTTP